MNYSELYTELEQHICKDHQSIKINTMEMSFGRALLLESQLAVSEKYWLYLLNVWFDRVIELLSVFYNICIVG